MKIPAVQSEENDSQDLVDIIRQQVPPGGKALARLHMFEQSHGLRPPQPNLAEADTPFISATANSDATA